MPLTSRCATEKLHELWNCDESSLTPFVRVAVREKLLQLAGKTRGHSRHYTRKPPKFCLSCIKRVKELYPELNTDISFGQQDTEAATEDEEPSLHPPEKGMKLSPNIPLTESKLDQDEHLPSTCNKPTTSTSNEPIASIFDEPISLDFETNKPLIDISALSHGEETKLAYLLGKKQAHELKKTAQLLSRSRGMEQLPVTNVRTHESQSIDVVDAFLRGISSENTQFSSSNTYQLDKTVESILDLTGSNLVLPAHFKESVVLYALTGSKLALRILGSGGPHASYDAVKIWLQQQSERSVDVPQGDVVIAFDNNQILQRRWKVKLMNDVKCNIVTIVASFNMNTTGDLQKSRSLKFDWTDANELSPESKSKVKNIDQDNDIQDTHFSHLTAFLNREIDIVRKEQVEGTTEGTFDDSIDAMVTEAKQSEIYKKCYNCNYKDVPKSKHSCPQCGVKVTKSMFAAMNLDELGNVKLQPTKNVQ